MCVFPSTIFCNRIIQVTQVIISALVWKAEFGQWTTLYLHMTYSKPMEQVINKNILANTQKCSFEVYMKGLWSSNTVGLDSQAHTQLLLLQGIQPGLTHVAEW